ncbi:MAG: hypothetical protein ABW217_03920 [Polyangiaceae bacterium]
MSDEPVSETLEALAAPAKGSSMKVSGKTILIVVGVLAAIAFGPRVLAQLGTVASSSGGSYFGGGSGGRRYASGDGPLDFLAPTTNIGLGSYTEGPCESFGARMWKPECNPRSQARDSRGSWSGWLGGE